MATLTLRPNAAGTYTNIPSVYGAATHYEACGDNSDSTYVYGGPTVNKYDTYNLPNHTTESGTITNVQCNIRGKVSAVHVSTYFSIEGYTEGSLFLSGNFQDTSITTRSVDYALNAVTALAWTWAQIDALEIGGYMRETAGTDTVYIYDVWVVVTYTPSVKGRSFGFLIG